MRQDSHRAPEAIRQRPWKLLLWTAVASLIFGALQLGAPLENKLRMGRNSLHEHPASGDIVFVGIDDASLRKVREWPWPRAEQAELIRRATALNAERIFLDIIYDSPTDPSNDRQLADAIAASGRVVLADRIRLGTGTRGNRAVEGRPLPEFARHAKTASISLFYNFQNAVWQAPYAAKIAGAEVPSVASMMAGKGGSLGETFPLDYSIDPYTIPYVPAADLLAGTVDATEITGKTVIIGLNADELGDRFWIPGHGRMAGSVVHAIGAETLKAGTPLSLGWLPALAAALALCLASLLSRTAVKRQALLTGSFALLLGAPILLEQNHVFADITPGLFCLLVVTGRLAVLRWRQRGLTNVLSDLPNLEALRSRKEGNEQALIASRIHNYAQIASTLSGENERHLVRQVADRLSVGGGATEIFQGDEGIFAWFADREAPIGNHLEALHALFRAPLSAGEQSVDLAITFGVDFGGSRSATNRLGSALMAADEAWAEGLKWKFHDPSRQEEVSWRLSLLGELDAAIDNGEVWLAFQPQVELRSGTIVGAEALARWTHPIKGPISPTEFVTVAETHGRIGKLTVFVLERSISTAAMINRRGIPFSIAVNLSARLLTDRQLVERILALLDRHQLDPQRLTLELTETAALHSADDGLAMLDALRGHGVRIAIDDYGTGLSTLEYLKKVPANEIKIDQSFVKAMRFSRSDLLMVQSTIALAHSLGRTVVAEGVEDRQCLEELRTMECDLVQGFAIGRPMSVRELMQRLQSTRSRRVA